MTMTSPQEKQALFEKLEAFDIDGGKPDFSFADRLARDNGWSRPFAKKVLREYLRFVYLCATSKQMLTPSEEVDQAWHLHMVYTRSYWDDLCGEILGFPLHHDPTPGGAGAAEGYAAAYELAKRRYRDAFGHAPPADVWPSTKARFANAGRFQWVNLADHRLVSLKSLRAAWIAVGLGLTAAPVYAAGDWSSMLTVVGGVILIPVALLWVFGSRLKALHDAHQRKNAGAAGCGAGASGYSSKSASGDSDGGGGDASGCASGCGGCGG